METLSIKKKKSNYKPNQIDIVNWVDISDQWENPELSDLTFVDLFSGAGGISKGFELAGLNGISGLDWFKEAVDTYKFNFKHPIIYGDIKDQSIKDLFYKTVYERLDGRNLNVIAGGFPCQGFSMAGNRIVDDPRNSLYKEMLEITNHLKPDFIVCENVVGLRSMLDGNVEKMILDDFKNIGYDMNVTVLLAADYFVPQKRNRVIFIGNRIGLTNYHPKPILNKENYITVGQAIIDLMDIPENKDFNHIFSKHAPDVAQKMLELEEGKSLNPKYSDAFKKCPWNEPSSTIKENHGAVNVHPKLPRVITPREMARLQSFPDNFIFKGSKAKQLVQLGNAVPPLLAKAIAISIKKSYDKIPN